MPGMLPAGGEMTPERWARITDLLGEALDRPPSARAAYLEDLRAVDPEAADEVRSLLDAHGRAGEFLPDLSEPPPAADLCGRSLGAYRLTRFLGSGGMGTVYLAERDDGAFSKRVAVKLLAPAFGREQERFHRERELLARLQHPNIAHLLDGGTTPEGWPYLVMEYVDGGPIDRYCAERNLGLDDRLTLVQQVCAGVSHAHQRLVIHCDIKPENILVTTAGTAKLLDFGISRLAGAGMTATMHRPGTLASASPEQLEGRPLTTASDVYSIGVLAYLLLTGRWPYAGRSNGFAQTLHTVLSAEPVAASRLAEGLPHARRMRGDLDNVLAKAVAKDPARRYASVEQFADDIESYRQGLPVTARRPTLTYRAQKFAARHAGALLAGAAAVAALVAAVATSASQARLAEQRFQDLRRFSREVVFGINDSLATVPGTTASRKLLVETALQYLDRLSTQGRPDESLQLEIARAYIQVAKVQGGPFLPNLGETAGAIGSYRKAIAVLGRSPDAPAAERLGLEAYLNIAQLSVDPMSGGPDFDRAIALGEPLLQQDPGDVEMMKLLAQAYHGRATGAHLTDNVPEHARTVARAVRLRERVLEQRPGSWQDEVELAREYAQLALARTQQGDAASAHRELARARTLLTATHERHPGNQQVARGLAEIHSRSTLVLVSLGRPADGASEAGRAIALLEPLVASDAGNAQYHADLATAELRLAAAYQAQGRVEAALDLARRALEVRRGRARGQATMFASWGLAANLNTVSALLLEVSQANEPAAAALFDEARDAAETALAVAPSFNQLRRELAVSYEGLASAAAVRLGERSPQVRTLLEKSAAIWRDVFARSIGDRRQMDRRARVEALLAALATPPIEAREQRTVD